MQKTENTSILSKRKKNNPWNRVLYKFAGRAVALKMRKHLLDWNKDSPLYL